jgi:RNA-directed DNA polymerase
VLCRENMIKAYKRVVSNKGAAGIDGVRVEDLMAYSRIHWERICEEILAGRYRPDPVKQVEIPKPGGGVRLLGIPTVMDRMIQQAIVHVLTPIFDPGFSEFSFRFRPGRSAQDAVLVSRAHVESGRRWVVDKELERRGHRFVRYADDFQV